MKPPTVSSGPAVGSPSTLDVPPKVTGQLPASHEKAAPKAPAPAGKVAPKAPAQAEIKEKTSGDRKPPGIEVEQIAVPGTVSPPKFQQPKRRPFWMRPLFYVAVVIPTILSAVYYGCIASDIYISESHFVVRNTKQQASAGILGPLLGTGFTTSLNDIYTVQDYMLSKDAMSEVVDAEFHIFKSWQRNEIDPLNRFAGIAYWDKSLEAFSDYYQKRVTVTVDTTTSVACIKVSAFTAGDASGINESLLKAGEKLVNKLNDRAMRDALTVAESEVELAREKDKKAAKLLNDYRIANSLIDPTQQTTAQLGLISTMTTDLISTKTLLAQAQALSATNPQIPLLQKRLEILLAEMAAQMGKLTVGDSSLIAKQAEYDRLVTERTFTTSQVAAALTNSEQARTAAISQQLYLERIAKPSKPDVAVEPRRVRSVLTTFVIGMLAWGILALLAAGVREHLG